MAHCTQDRVDGVAFGPLEMVPFEQAITFEVRDNRLDGGSSFTFAPYGW